MKPPSLLMQHRWPVADQLDLLSVRATLPSPSELFTSTVGEAPQDWQARVLTSPARRQLLAITRQGGKSTACAVKAAHLTLAKPGALVIALSPSLRQSQELFRKCLTAYRALGQPVPAESETKLSLELVTGSRILSLPGSERTTRGYTAPDLILIDEAAQVEDELLYSVLPMMAANPESQLIAMTTPYGKRGWFSDAWHDGGDDWERHLVTVDEVGHITEEEVEAFKRIMPDWWFRSEFLCEFLDPQDQVFATEAIEKMVRPGLNEWNI